MQMENPYHGYNVIKRGGAVVSFEPERIASAIQRCFLDVYRGEAGQRMSDVVASTTAAVVEMLTRSRDRTSFHIEDIQDAVELVLMRSGDHLLARGYVVFREQRAARRAAAMDAPAALQRRILLPSGAERQVDAQQLAVRLAEHAQGLNVDVLAVAEQALREVFDGATTAQLESAMRLSARTFIELEPDYDRLVARLRISEVYQEVLGRAVAPEGRADALRSDFATRVREGVEAERYAPALLGFDLDRLAQALQPSRDMNFTSLGIETLYDRYFIHSGGRRIETPQTFFMRVAMGLALNEIDRETRAIEFYEVLSTFRFLSSTPTLFNAGTLRPQLASCFLTTVPDDLEGIYGAIGANARLQKYAGGLGNDWTPVRALGSYIKGTNGKSQGVVPFLKVVNDTAVAVNQGGKRPGAVCAYLETWHLDIEEFLELRKNTGDDRRRTHDMNTANWVPDLFMERVMANADWTLFSPNDAPHLHDLFGQEFVQAYEACEAKARAGEWKGPFKTVRAVDLWRRMLTMLFETGHPWITFKDPCNLRSPQRHVGVVHSSNLCTEITLNTSPDEIAVCNIGSVNLVAHLGDDGLDHQALEETVRSAMRMLDNVIDINFYTMPQARLSNLKHRPVGLGQMGFHEMLQALEVPYNSPKALQLADEVTERIAFVAYDTSADLARERGAYSTFQGSYWSHGILPQASQHFVASNRSRPEFHQVDPGSVLGVKAWSELNRKIESTGMRNSNCLAIAPTATIGNIAGCSAGIDPVMSNLQVKSNMSGEFTLINERLVRKLKALGVWDKAMLADLKFYDGSVQKLHRVPQEVKDVFATAFEIGPHALIEAASRRQKWIDQAQSLNLYISGASGKLLDEVYKLAWTRGLKTTYYLRTLSASPAEKSTLAAGQLNAVSASADGPVCTLRPGDAGFSACEACQ